MIQWVVKFGFGLVQRVYVLSRQQTLNERQGISELGTISLPARTGFLSRTPLLYHIGCWNPMVPILQSFYLDTKWQFT